MAVTHIIRALTSDLPLIGRYAAVQQTPVSAGDSIAVVTVDHKNRISAPPSFRGVAEVIGNGTGYTMVRFAEYTAPSSE